MTRVAWVLAALALGLAIPVAVLVARALDSAAVEEESRHRAIAERAFDEMESTLSRFLAGEEARPFDDYRFYPDGGPPRRSPLAEEPDLPFVLGHFQIDPDGSFHTPRIPRDTGAAGARGDFQPGPSTDGLTARLEQAWKGAAPRSRAAPARSQTALERLSEVLEPDRLQVPEEEELLESDAEKNRLGFAAAGSKDAIALSQKKQEAEDEPATAPDAKDDLDSFDLYRSFNLASKRRLDRQQKVTTVPRRALAAPPAQSATPETAAPSALRDEPGRSAAGAAARTEPEVARVRVALDPMLGRTTSGNRVLLYRTVIAGEQAYRQGLVLDRERLGDWLREQVIEPSGLARADVRTEFLASTDFGSGPDGGEPDRHPYRYRHAFAEPFDAVAVELSLPALPGGRGTVEVHALAALLAIVAAVGLFAVYRMVSVVVHFAERRSRFAASVSHELKTPLTSIRMYGEMLRDGLVPSADKRDEYYRTITAESERLSRLIDNVLDFSRLEKGEYDARTETGDPRPTLREAVSKLAPHAARQGFSIRLEDDEAVVARFDPDALTQVVFNLLDNALKYAADASRKEILLSCRPAPGGGATLCVRDYGPGAPEGELESIFDAFYRLPEQSERRLARGTGIGLALVRELARSMGGSASAENAPGGGLAVTIRLPAPARAPSA